jgi:hypothetical protein
MMTLIHLPVRANIPRPIRNALSGQSLEMVKHIIYLIFIEENMEILST